MAKADFVPTPEQIRQACLELQRNWTPDEERYRRVGPARFSQRYAIPTEVPAPRDRFGQLL